MVKLVVNDTRVTDLNRTLGRCVYGGVVLTGGVEVFSLKQTREQKQTTKQLKEAFRERNKPVTQEMVVEFKRKVDVLLAMAEVVDISDYDFEMILNDVTRITAAEAVADAREALEMVSRASNTPGLANNVWETLRGLVNLFDSQCAVYRYSPSVDDDPFAERGNLHAVSLFFVNTTQAYKRLAFVWLRGRSLEFEEADTMSVAAATAAQQQVVVARPMLPSSAMGRGASGRSGSGSGVSVVAAAVGRTGEVGSGSGEPAIAVVPLAAPDPVGSAAAGPTILKRLRRVTASPIPPDFESPARATTPQVAASSSQDDDELKEDDDEDDDGYAGDYRDSGHGGADDEDDDVSSVSSV